MRACVQGGWVYRQVDRRDSSLAHAQELLRVSLPPRCSSHELLLVSVPPRCGSSSAFSSRAFLPLAPAPAPPFFSLPSFPIHVKFLINCAALLLALSAALLLHHPFTQSARLLRAPLEVEGGVCQHPPSSPKHHDQSWPLS